MAASGHKCGDCHKAVYPVEQVVAAGRSWHKGCFKCQAVVEGNKCGISLTLSSHVAQQGAKLFHSNIRCAPIPNIFAVVIGVVYCSKHAPKPVFGRIHKEHLVSFFLWIVNPLVLELISLV